MQRWTKDAINAWWESQPWLVGANYVPSNAVNNVEMWKKDTFSPDLIRKELNWARELGMNTMRVFLSYTVWKAEGDAFLSTFDQFLSIAQACGMKILPILFDDCAFDGGADPFYGPQPDPVPGVHNSRWVPSPGARVQDDPAMAASCREYVDAVIGAHRTDERILAWDLFNEPGNSGRKLQSLPLMVHAFSWARSHDPIQPMCCSIWRMDEDWLGMNRVMAELSDVINLHCYANTEYTKQVIEHAAAASGRPIFVTEWLHRPAGNDPMQLWPYFKEKKIGAWQWGLVQGRTQTHLSWETMNGGEKDDSPALWQHDLLLPDGRPYREEETALLKRLTKI
ncbi:MAG: 1,4-beta-xylanase [Clostridiales bacterium]|nr:1,4-beta-xylanase [Clostridiales bacterium]